MKKATLLSFSVFALMAGVSPSFSAECTLFAPDVIFPGDTFDVRVSRVPGYPGGWFSPTIRLEVNYPTNAGWAYKQIDQRTIPKVNIIRADATLFAPSNVYPDRSGGFVAGGIVSITAVVSEPTTGRPIRTVCTTTTTLP